MVSASGPSWVVGPHQPSGTLEWFVQKPEAPDGDSVTSPSPEEKGRLPKGSFPASAQTTGLW